jgi:hypothetical protein
MNILVLPIFFLALILQLFLPWWIIGIIAFGISFWQAKTGKQAFNSAFIAIFLLWLTKSLWHSLPNENMLANRVGQMLMLPDWPFNWTLVLIITCVIGWLAAVLAGLSGYLVRAAFTKTRTEK